MKDTKEQLELEELKINLKRKIVEIEKEKIEVEWEKARIEEMRIDGRTNESRILIEKIAELRAVLTDVVLDEVNTVQIDGPTYKRMAFGRIEVLARKKLGELLLNL